MYIVCVYKCLNWEVKFLLKSFASRSLFLSCNAFLGMSMDVLLPSVCNDSLWHRGIDKCSVSDSLTRGPVHHRNVDVQMLTLIHMQEVLSQTPNAA